MENQIHPDVSDTELVQRAKLGDLNAFELLVSRYEQRVYSLAMRILQQQQDAEDVTQETLLSALENLESYRGDARFSTWLLRIATHAALKIIRKRKGLRLVSLDEATEPSNDSHRIPHPEFIADWQRSPEQLAQNREIQQLLDKALAELDDKHRLVFLLRDMEGLSIKETADALGLTEANTKVRLLRARLQLRERLTRAFGDPATQLFRPPHLSH